MPDESKTGTNWKDDELDAILEDYFDMLTEELAGRIYNKTKHRTDLMARIGRDGGAVEFKHQNISAVLNELGVPWIAGYKPRKNYQNAIFDAIDRYLTNNPETVLSQKIPRTSSFDSDEVFVPLPTLSRSEERVPPGLKQLIRKFDPVERDFRNRSLGKAGEEFVVQVERHHLSKANRRDLANKVRWVAAEDGDGAGYDVLSFDANGRERLLEVKTTNGPERTPFLLTRNECAMAEKRPEDWRIYRVHSFSREPRIFRIEPPLSDAVHLIPDVWRASFP